MAYIHSRGRATGRELSLMTDGIRRRCVERPSRLSTACRLAKENVVNRDDRDTWNSCLPTSIRLLLRPRYFGQNGSHIGGLLRILNALRVHFHGHNRREFRLGA